MNDSEKKTSKWKGWLVIFIIIGFLGSNYEECNSPKCAFCGSYSYSEFVGNDKSDPKIIHALELSGPKNLEDGTIRGTAIIGIQLKYSEPIIYKGTFIKNSKSDPYDGMIRIEYKQNSITTDWEQITFGDYNNFIFYNISDNNLLLKSASNVHEFGICCYARAAFIKS